MNQPALTTSIRHRPRPSTTTLALVMASMMLLALPAVAEPSADNHTQALDNLRATSRAFSAIEKNVSPAVVSIRVEKTIRGIAGNREMPFNDPSELFGDEFAKRFFGEANSDAKRYKQNWEQFCQILISSIDFQNLK